MRTTTKHSLSLRITFGAVLLAALVCATYFALIGATEPGSDTAILIGTIGFCAALGAIVLASLDLVRQVTRPIRDVALGAKRLGAGDFSARVPEGGVADVSELATALNSMASSLAGARSELERQQSEVASFRREAASANQAKTEFLSRMSHELRTPLNAILGFAQLLELDDLDARQRDNVAHIVSGGRHLLDLINEVLEISRIEAGSLSPAIEPVNAAAIVREALELVTPLAAQREISVNASLGAHEDMWIAADQQRLKQVLLNLMANAVKYNRDGGSVTVELRRVGNRARILVVDTGLGIPQDQLPKLFMPFERLGAESSGVEGTGLGLVLALRLMQAMEGTLGVESQPWIGSTFHVELPLAEAPAPVAPTVAPTQRAVSGVRSAPAEGRQWRILYIEDDSANVRLMSELLAEEPRLELMTTMQGSLGIELARRHQPDLILLDLHLPDINGFEVIRRLRADELSREIPVIAVSADATDETRARMTALGAERYLTKPLGLNNVMTAIWDVLEAPAPLLRTPGSRP
jgi:signal transduction histidine kinase/CheY-like chemotaxis protein